MGNCPLCVVGCWTACLAFTSWDVSSVIRSLQQPRTSPDISKCLWGTKSPTVKSWQVHPPSGKWYLTSGLHPSQSLFPSPVWNISNTRPNCEPQGSHLPRISFLSMMPCGTALHSHQHFSSPWIYVCRVAHEGKNFPQRWCSAENLKGQPRGCRAPSPEPSLASPVLPHYVGGVFSIRVSAVLVGKDEARVCWLYLRHGKENHRTQTYK